MSEDLFKLKQLKDRLDEITNRQNNISSHIELLSDEINSLQKTIEAKHKSEIILEAPKIELPLTAALPKQEEVVLDEAMVEELEVSKINENNWQELLVKKPNPAKRKLDRFVLEQELQSKPKAKTVSKVHGYEPTAVDKAISFVVKFFSEGNPVVRVGMVILFFGLSFLVMYAANKGYFPIELRLSLVGAIAISLIGLGWKTRNKEGGYGLVLQGGGIAGLYLTLFAASKFYFVLPLKLTFALMFVVVVCSVVLAVMQNAQVLALMATAGGFLAPILTSDGSKNYVGLFTFYLLINIGILSVAWFKTWRLLNWVGFMFTFAIFSIWALSDYRPADYYATQPFLIAYFAMYLVIAILFSIKQPPNLKGLIDGSLIFGMPITGFGLQAKLLNHTEYGLAISALVLFIIYTSLALWVRKKYIETHKNLFEAFIALGVTFGTLAIPLAFDCKWTSASWAIESVGLIWVGLRQQRLRPQVVGMFLYLGSVVSLFMKGWLSPGTIPFITGDFFSLIIFSASALCIGYFYYQSQLETKKSDYQMSYLAMVMGWLWWLSAGLLVICGFVKSDILYPCLLTFFSVSCLLFSESIKVIQWKHLAHFQYWNLPLCLILGFSIAETSIANISIYPSDPYCLIAITVFLSIQYLFLWKQTTNESQQFTKVYHVITAWLIIGLVFWEAFYRQELHGIKGNNAIMLWLGCFALPLVFLLCVTKIQKWPFLPYQNLWKNIIPVPLIVFLGIWLLYTCTKSGTDFHYYFPIINPYDLLMFGVIGVFYWLFERDFLSIKSTLLEFQYAIFGAFIFLWLNVVLLRAINYYGDVNYRLDAQWESSIVQVAISILWSLCALVVMQTSRVISSRDLWKVGGLLLVAVVIKLFLKDLSDVGGLERIISFMVVGILMLLIGYIAPIPPRVLESKTNSDEILSDNPTEEIKSI